MSTNKLGIFFVLAVITLVVSAGKPIYDHQNTTYYARFYPLNKQGYDVSLAPFFSPDWSTPTHVSLINAAKSSVDIMIPSFSSWNGCTFGTTCVGCYASFLHANESFPVWQALVNAVHRGVNVRVLTNNYEDKLCNQKMTPLVYLQLAGAKVNYFTTISFTHTKYICTDNSTAAVSSINYSKASMIENREAGIVVSNDRDGEIVGYLQAVFNYDWSMSIPFPVGEYTERDYHYVNDKTPLAVNQPSVPPSIKCDYKSPNPAPISGPMDISVITSPDFAWDSIIAPLRHAKRSLWLSIYQITDDSFCDLLVDLSSQIQVKVFVSNDIYAQYDAAEAAKCYTKLYQHGLVVKKSHPKCLRYSHQKFWIIDDEFVTMSTGNWSPSDYPQAPYTFPPYPSSDYRKVNRDFTLQVTNSDVVARFKQVFDLDYEQGADFKPAF